MPVAGYNKFPKTSRLLGPADFKPVFDGADIKVSNRHFLILAKSNGGHNPRLGLVIAKKNVAHAVQRNRLKRIIRNAFRHNRDLLGDLDLVVLARSKAGALGNEVVGQQIVELMRDISRKLATSSTA